jgi:hypothetical protein
MLTNQLLTGDGLVKLFVQKRWKLEVSFCLGHMFVRFVRLLLGNYSLSWFFLDFLNAQSDVALNSGGLKYGAFLEVMYGYSLEVDVV